MLSKSQQGNNRRFVPMVGSSVAFVTLAIFVYCGGTNAWDRAVFLEAAAHQDHHLDLAAQFFSWFASGWALLAISVGATMAHPVVRKWRHVTAGVVVAVAGGELIIGFVKHVIQRPRPLASADHLGYAFPSGHAFFTVVVYGLLSSLLCSSRRTLGFALSVVAAGCILIGASRIYLGVHYVSDVLGGFLLAIPWLYSCVALATRLNIKNLRSGPR